MFTPSGSAMLDGDNFETIFLVQTNLKAPRLTLADADRECAIFLHMSGVERFERTEYGAAIGYRIWDRGWEIERVMLAEARPAPGLRVFFASPTTKERFSCYYLDPGWDLRVEKAGAGRLQICLSERRALGALRRLPGAGSLAGLKASLRRRRTGPVPTLLEKKLWIVSEWRRAQPGETQEHFCARLGIGASTLRSWTHELVSLGMLPR